MAHLKNIINYQYLPGDEMTSRDKEEVGSKYWNEGKFDNFVKPFIADDVKEKTFVDFGCNAGLFLKLAENMGFNKVIGIDYHKGAYDRAVKFKEENGGKYDIRNSYISQSIDRIPISDYGVLSNSHYYILIDRWLKFVHKAMWKLDYVIVITHEREDKLHVASRYLKDIRTYFKLWKEVEFIDSGDMKNDPAPRPLKAVCFKNPLLERIPINTIKSESSENISLFLDEIDKGVPPTETKYRNILEKRLSHWWGKEKLLRYLQQKADMYEDIKKNGMTHPLIVRRKDMRMLDGNHRMAMMSKLGFKTIFAMMI